MIYKDVKAKIQSYLASAVRCKSIIIKDEDDMENYLQKFCKLPANTKRAWVERLLSGDYKQTREGMLRYTGDKTPKYCCLGVLCELRRDLRRDPKEPEIVLDSGGFLMNYQPPERLDGIFDSDAFPSGDEYAGIPIELMKALASANDGGANFRQIGKWINENL